MTGRRERERKAARVREEVWFNPWTGRSYRAFWVTDEVDAYPSPRPRADEKFAVDFDGTIILHPSQWKVIP